MGDCLQGIDLHGWDALSQSWHGPDELSYSLEGQRRILRALRKMPGSWYGKLREQLPGAVPLTFSASIYDLGDAGLLSIDLDGSPGGPLELVLVIPAHRRSKIRSEFAFEFASFMRFLEGPESAGSEMAIHDYIERTLRETDPSRSLIFSIEARFEEPEIRLLIAPQVEAAAMSMIAWMKEKDALAGAFTELDTAHAGG